MLYDAVQFLLVADTMDAATISHIVVDREAPAGLVLPVEAVSAALAVWAAAPVLAEPGAAAAALAAWAAAAATAAEPDADADIMTKGKPHLTVGLPFCLFVI